LDILNECEGTFCFETRASRPYAYQFSKLRDETKGLIGILESVTYTRRCKARRDRTSVLLKRKEEPVTVPSLLQQGAILVRYQCYFVAGVLNREQINWNCPDFRYLWHTLGKL